MTYTIDESLNDGEFTAAGDVGGVFGTPRHIESITIHHWGAFGQTHDGVLDFFVNRNRNTSAHFVVSAGRINCLVSPANAAWAAGNAYGNATSIHIECHPEATPQDYATVAWLVWWLRQHYGNLPLRPHSSWTPTACPGIWDLSKVDRLARAQAPAATVPQASKPATKPVTPAAKPTAAAKPGFDPARDIHWVVAKGDTLGEIQAYYNGPSVAAIAKHNGIKDVNKLTPGQRVFIPGPLVWVIEGPDTIRSIARYYGVDPAYLAKLNGLAGPDATIYIGNTLTIKK